MNKEILLANLDKLHITGGGIIRIRENLKINPYDIVGWCERRIKSKKSVVTREGKNYYVVIDKYIITVHADSFTIITAHFKTENPKMIFDYNKVNKLIDKSRVSIISSVDNEGYPNTKAMFKVRKREGFKDFYFSTNTSSMRVKQFLENPKACLYFYDKTLVKGVMLRGKMEVLKDKESKKSIWQIGDRIYYPKGIDDPDYCVLKFTAINGRYYSSFKSEDFTI
jgi:general stress protein 26